LHLRNITHGITLDDDRTECLSDIHDKLVKQSLNSYRDAIGRIVGNTKEDINQEINTLSPNGHASISIQIPSAEVQHWHENAFFPYPMKTTFLEMPYAIDAISNPDEHTHYKGQDCI
jgi:hypothetical protein